MSKIEWTERTWNPVVGCTPVSPGCLNCYAATMARRLEAMGRPEYAPRHVPAKTGTPYDSWEPAKTIRIAEVRGGRAVFTGSVRTVPKRLTDPLHWRKPQMVFVNSMSDLFHKDVPFDFIDQVFAVMALCPKHTFQVLTKRPQRMAEYFTERTWGDVIANVREDGSEVGRKLAGLCDYDAVMSGTREGVAGYHEPIPGRRKLVVDTWPLPNVWLGTSVENQAAADERIPHLLRCPAAVRFLSCEPLLGPVDLGLTSRDLGEGGATGLTAWRPNDRAVGLHWGIVGGESGGRPCNVEWIEWIVKQFRDGGVPCFVKQLGSRPCIQEQEHGDTVTYERRGGFWPDTERGRANAWIVRMNNHKGGDPAEWPEHLRVREFPAKATAAACRSSARKGGEP